MGSKVSRCAGPPTMLMKMQLFAVPSGRCVVALPTDGSARLAALAVAAVRNSRRDKLDMGLPRGWWREPHGTPSRARCKYATSS